MKLLSLDPSSTCTGYAVFDGSRLIEHGTLTGNKRTDSAITRVLSMRDELLVLLQEHSPGVALIELPLDRQYTRQGGKRSSMPIWAGAAWALWMVLVDESHRLGEHIEPMAIYPISNTRWTAGSSKQDRQNMVRAKHNSYDPARDTASLDMSDAIALGDWYLLNRQRHDALAQVLKQVEGAAR